MKALVCEMCGSQDVVKQNSLFVCQCCGTKYSVEEARKMMVEGTVRIDRSNELENLYKAARNARETGDDESAIRHYEKISAMDPDNWEALFYLVILKTNEIKNSQIQSSAVSVSNCLPKVFDLINDTIEDEAEKKEAVWEVLQQCQTTAEWLTRASHNFYKSVTKGDGVIALTGLFGAISSAGSVLTALTEDNQRCVAIANIMFYCGNYVSAIFDMNDEDYCGYAVWAWKQTLDFHADYQQTHKTQTLFNEESVCRLTDNIKRYAPKMLEGIDKGEDSNHAVLTIEFDSNAGGAGQLWYSIDHGEKNTLNRKEQKPHFLECGSHTLSILNPFKKKDYYFKLEGSKTIRVYDKSFSMDVT